MEVAEEIIELFFARFIARSIARHAGNPDLVLVALQEIQTQAGYIPSSATGALAKALGSPEG